MGRGKRLCVRENMLLDSTVVPRYSRERWLPPCRRRARAINLGLTRYRSGRLLPLTRSGDLLPWEGLQHQELVRCVSVLLSVLWPCGFACVTISTPFCLSFRSITLSTVPISLFLSRSLSTALPVSICLYRSWTLPRSPTVGYQRW